MRQRKEKLLTKCHASKKGETADKVSCLKKKKTLLTKCHASKVKKIYNRKIRLLAICHASNSKFYKSIYIHNHEIQKNLGT